MWFILKIINTYSMPNVLGQEQMLALDRLENLNATTEVEYSYSEEFEEGVVMAQSHRAGVRVKYATPVTVTVSLGSQWYYMEDYLGAKVDGAVEALTAQGVESIEVEYVQSDNPAGTIVAVEPDIGTQSKDTPVLLVVSGQRIIMPLLTGRSLESARALLNAEGLAVGNISEGYSADAKAGIVIAQSVAANSQVLAGTSVDLTINQAQQPVYYPASKLSVVVPLNGTQVRVQIRLSTGEVQEVYQGVLNTGTYRIALSSSEPGVHAVDISMDGVLMDEQNITFE